MAKRYATLEDRIIANSVMSRDSFYNGTPCWEWVGKTIISRISKNRYPVLTVRVEGKGPRNRRAHRLSLTEFRGLRPPTRGHIAAHLCNNSFCVNPMHLAWATEKQNMRQCVRDGRHNSNPANDFDRLEDAA